MTLRQIFEENATYVWRVLRRLGVREADVDDVCQEVFLVVHRKIGTFDGSSSMRTWLYGICLRLASEYRRRPHRRREEVAESVPEQVVAASQDESLDRSRALARLDAALDQLDDEKRAVFVLYEIEQLPMAEIAQAAGCPLQTAYSRLRAARMQVEAEMRRLEIGAFRQGTAPMTERTAL
ncbi:RNA polymerase sigma factor [Sorangium sp. So ce131]|uniref:RNA polymerase sigma factor n=1 Tax=Sorangium sp. So ce131 TaxID=3133282 RepID=UPI003F641AAD